MKILPFSEKPEWDLQAKYSIGNVGMRTSNTSDPSTTEIKDDIFK
jgi:hypothetical protein